MSEVLADHSDETIDSILEETIQTVIPEEFLENPEIAAALNIEALRGKAHTKIMAMLNIAESRSCKVSIQRATISSIVMDTIKDDRNILEIIYKRYTEILRVFDSKPMTYHDFLSRTTVDKIQKQGEKTIVIKRSIVLNFLALLKKGITKPGIKVHSQEGKNTAEFTIDKVRSDCRVTEAGQSKGINPDLCEILE